MIVMKSVFSASFLPGQIRRPCREIFISLTAHKQASRVKCKDQVRLTQPKAECPSLFGYGSVPSAPGLKYRSGMKL